MHQKADNITPPINEQDLQAITGGCARCKFLGEVAEMRAKYLQQTSNPKTADTENKIKNLQALAEFGELNKNKPLLPHGLPCKDNAGMSRELAKNNLQYPTTV